MPTEDQNNPVSVELTRHASSSGRGRGSGFRGRGRGRGGGGFGAVRRNSGSLAQPGHGQNKEEQMESYWQDVEKVRLERNDIFRIIIYNVVPSFRLGLLLLLQFSLKLLIAIFPLDWSFFKLAINYTAIISRPSQHK